MTSLTREFDGACYTLDLLIDLDGADVVTEVTVVDAGLSDHCRADRHPRPTSKG